VEQNYGSQKTGLASKGMISIIHCNDDAVYILFPVMSVTTTTYNVCILYPSKMWPEIG